MISACIITKNQSSYLDKCLNCLSKIGVELVVVDTGSSDNSVEIASKYTHNIFSFPWINDFSVARNYAAKKASYEIILSVDTDEFLESGDISLAIDYLTNYPNAIGLVTIDSYFDSCGEEKIQKEKLPRLYNKTIYEFRGAIHEQLYNIKTGEKSFPSFDASLSFEHIGYNLSGTAKIDKAKRNISLLEKELANSLKTYGLSENYNPLSLAKNIQNELAYIYYQLGKSNYFLGNYENSSEYFNVGLSFDLDENLEYVKDMVETLGYSLLNLGRINEASALCSLEDTFGNSADFCFLLGLIYMNLTEFDNAIAHFTKATAFNSSKIQGTDSYLANYNIGVIYECTNRIDKAKEYYRKCGNYRKAKERLSYL